MTKKSLARQERDSIAKKSHQELEQFYASNKGWDELNELYTSVATMLATSNDNLLKVYSNSDIVTNLSSEKAQEIQLTLDGIRKDFEQFANELVAIREMHKDKTGGIKNVDDSTKVIGIFESYNTFSGRYHAIITPNYTFLMQEAAFAEARLAASLDNSATDPNVITDVVVKEPTEQ